jgi:hypothetical protein
LSIQILLDALFVKFNVVFTHTLILTESFVSVLLDHLEIKRRKKRN